MDAEGRSYGAVGGRLFLVNFPVALTVPGTAASITAIANTQFIVPANFNGRVRGFTAYVKTGGSAGSAKAANALLLQRSLAGTGAYATVGSAIFGSAFADDTAPSSVGVDSTVQILAGDWLRLAVAVGTVAISQIVLPSICLEETFKGS